MTFIKKRFVYAAFQTVLISQVHAIPTQQAAIIQQRCSLIKTIIDTLDEGFRLLLEKGNAAGYKLILEKSLALEKIEDEPHYEQQLSVVFNETVDLINSEVSKIIQFLKKKPKKPDINYINQFKNEIDLIALMDISVQRFALIAKKLFEKGYKEQAVFVRMVIAHVMKAKAYWEAKVQKDSLQMIDNLFKTMKK